MITRKNFNKNNFIFGTATSSFQIEGGVDQDDRLPSIWDNFCDSPSKIVDGSTGDVACDHYHKWEEDVELLHDLGVDAYRFSISWCRIITKQGEVNSKGIQFYRKLLTKLKEKGIQSYVTLYHWDMPQWLEEQGGWLNRNTIHEFEKYADVASRELGDLVNAWCTLNEPFCSAYLGYGIGVHAPGSVSDKNAFLAGHHLLLAHGLALKKIRTNNPGIPAGIVLNVTPGIPATSSEQDAKATEAWEELNVDWFFGPVFNQSYSDRLFQIWEGHNPPIEEGDMEIIGQTNDFVGINYYTVMRIRAESGSRFAVEETDTVERTDMGWEVNPDAFKNVLIKLSKDYPNLPPIYITENGMASRDEIVDGRVDDHQRLEYIQNHLDSLLQAINAGVDVRGYFLWSMMDNFEWAEGYTKRFGIYYVDYASLKRTPKKSAVWFKEFLSSKK